MMTATSVNSAPSLRKAQVAQRLRPPAGLMHNPFLALALPMVLPLIVFLI